MLENRIKEIIGRIGTEPRGGPFGLASIEPREQQPEQPSSSEVVATAAQPGNSNTLSTTNLVHHRSITSSASNSSFQGFRSGRDSVVVLSPDAPADEWKDVHKQAKSFMTRGQFESAFILCTRAKNLLVNQRATPNPDLVRVQLQMEIITLLSGGFQHYREATESLRRLKDECKSDGSVVLAECIRWLANSLALQGRYKEALQELKESKLPGHEREGNTEIMVISGVDVIADDDIAIMRELALTFEYLGFLTRAQVIIEFLLRHLEQRLKDMDVSRGPEDSEVKGPIATALARTRKDDPDPDPVLNSLVNMRHSVLYTAAAIYTLSGNYKKALRRAEEAWQGRKRQLSSRHVKTIEALSLRAYLLALLSRSDEAESICNETLKALSSTELGLRHPQAIRVMKTLVFVFRIQLRLVEAVDTGESLCRMATEFLTASHPETLKARAELASSLRSAADYKGAEEMYIKTVQASLQVYSDDPEHPETLRYQSELAHVYACKGRLDEAEQLALATLWKQRHAYQFEGSSPRKGVVEISS